jgi:hypothetical protein
MRRFTGFVRARTWLALALGIGVGIAAGGGSAYALASVVLPPQSGAITCVTGPARIMEHTYTVAANFPGCPKGSFGLRLGSGANGANGISVTAAVVDKTTGDLMITLSNGKTSDAGHVVGANGANGAPGSNGAPGGSSVTNVTAQTQLRNWPDTGGAGDVWALDNFTRTLSVTVEDQVNNSHCGGAPACYAVFGTISDNGTSVPQDGQAAPNNSTPATIIAKNITQIVTTGTASFQFYATSAAIDAKNVPATDDAKVQGKLASTTDWGELAFPAGTKFFGPALTAYDWNYSAALSYVSGGTSVSCNQVFNDAVNPGDDGQGAADGNITGTCPTT